MLAPGADGYYVGRLVRLAGAPRDGLNQPLGDIGFQREGPLEQGVQALYFFRLDPQAQLGDWFSFKPLFLRLAQFAIGIGGYYFIVGVHNCFL